MFLMPFTLSAVELKVVTEERPPYVYFSGRQIVGDATVAVEQTLQAANVSYQINVYPWARSYKLALSQNNILIYPIIKTPEREPLFHWFCPILRGHPIYLIKLSSRTDIDINSLDDAKRFRIGVSREDWNEHFLVAEGFSATENLDVSADEESNLLQLIAGRVDMILVTEDSIKMRMKWLNFSQDLVNRALDKDFRENKQICMAISKQSSERLLTKIQKVFSAINK